MLMPLFAQPLLFPLLILLTAGPWGGPSTLVPASAHLHTSMGWRLLLVSDSSISNPLILILYSCLFSK